MIVYFPATFRHHDGETLRQYASAWVGFDGNTLLATAKTGSANKLIVEGEAVLDGPSPDFENHTRYLVNDGYVDVIKAGGCGCSDPRKKCKDMACMRNILAKGTQRAVSRTEAKQRQLMSKEEARQRRDQIKAERAAKRSARQAAQQKRRAEREAGQA